MNTTITFPVLTITGPDSFKFLQGQLTADLSELESKSEILSAYCNRQGRVISVFYISNSKDGYTLIFLGDTVENFLRHLNKYAVFSKIKFSDISSFDNLDKTTQGQIKKKISLDYCINNLIPVITHEYSEKYLPDNLNLIDLGAVNFKKGCFLGQEVIARVYYKGKTKKHLVKKDKANLEESPEILVANDTHALLVQ